MNTKLRIIEELLSLDYQIPGGQTKEQFANAFTESMLMTILANVKAWKKG